MKTQQQVYEELRDTQSQEEFLKILRENMVAGWTNCKDCIYFEDCETKEDRDGCYMGDEE